MPATLMSAEDHRRVASAVRAAEDRTSAEIYCVIARASDSYFPHAAFAVSLATLIAGVVVAFLLHLSWFDVTSLRFAAAEALAGGLAVALVAWRPALRLPFVPKAVRYRRAHDNAMRQFLARNVHRTRARTGALLFVSIAERYATVIADAGIAAHVDQAEWNAIVAGLTEAAAVGRHADGFEAAVRSAGRLLAEHFPKRADDSNELDDHVVEL